MESLGTDLEQELFSQAYLMVCEQYPINEGIIRLYMPRRLREWYLDNHQSLTKITAKANRKRKNRFDKWLKKNPAFHDPRERPNEIPRGLKPEYLKQEDLTDLMSAQCPNNPGLDGLITTGRYAPNFDYMYSVAEEEIEKVKNTYRLLYMFVAEDDTDRAIIKYLESQFDPSDPMILLELEKISHKRIAKEVGVSESTVSRHLAAMKKRFRHVDGARRKDRNHPCDGDTKAA